MGNYNCLPLLIAVMVILNPVCLLRPDTDDNLLVVQVTRKTELLVYTRVSVRPDNAPQNLMGNYKTRKTTDNKQYNKHRSSSIRKHYQV